MTRTNNDDYENETRGEYENEYGELNEPWDFSPMDVVGIGIVLFLFLFFVYLVAVNR